MSPGIPLLSPTISLSAASSEMKVAVPTTSVTRYGKPNVEGVDILHRKAGSTDNIVSIRDFLARKATRK